MAESIFLKLEGKTAKNKIWDFLVTYQDYDYSLKEISELSEVGYTRLKELFKEFVKKNIVIQTRQIGNAKLYKLNKKNPIVTKFIEYYWTVVDTHLAKQEKKENDYTSSRVNLGAVSARTI